VANIDATTKNKNQELIKPSIAGQLFTVNDNSKNSLAKL
jgi:hypothetical protein